MVYDKNDNQNPELGGFDLSEAIVINPTPGVNVGDPPMTDHLLPRQLRFSPKHVGVAQEWQDHNGHPPEDNLDVPIVTIQQLNLELWNKRVNANSNQIPPGLRGPAPFFLKILVYRFSMIIENRYTIWAQNDKKNSSSLDIQLNLPTVFFLDYFAVEENFTAAHIFDDVPVDCRIVATAIIFVGHTKREMNCAIYFFVK